MPSPCHETRLQILAELHPHAAEPAGAEVRTHLEGCAACRKLADEWRRQAASLRSLSIEKAPAELDERVALEIADAGRTSRAAAGLALLTRLEAPAAMEGRIVSVFHAGQRQDRAIDSLHRLGRRAAPSELEGRIQGWSESAAEQGDLRAPEVLERLVAEELRDPQRAMAGRFSRRLERQRAPRGLEARVQKQIRPRPGASLRERRWAGLVAYAAGLLVLAGIGTYWISGGFDAGSRGDEFPFEVHRAQSIAELSGSARSLASALGGGILDSIASSRPEGEAR